MAGMLLSPVPNYPVTSMTFANGTLVTTHENGVRMFRPALLNGKFTFSASVGNKDKSDRPSRFPSNNATSYEKYQRKAENMIEKWRQKKLTEVREEDADKQRTTRRDTASPASTYIPASVASAAANVTNYIPSALSDVNFSSVGSFFSWGSNPKNSANSNPTKPSVVSSFGGTQRGTTASSSGPTSSSTLKESFASTNHSRDGNSNTDDYKLENNHDGRMEVSSVSSEDDWEGDFGIYEQYSHRQDSNLINSYKVVSLSPYAASCGNIPAAKKNYIAVASGDDVSGHCVSLLGVGGAKFLSSFQIKSNTAAAAAAATTGTSRDTGRSSVRRQTGAYRITALKMECVNPSLGPSIAEPLAATDIQSRRSISHRQLKEANRSDDYQDTALRNSMSASRHHENSEYIEAAERVSGIVEGAYATCSRVIIAAGDAGGGIILCEGSKSFTVQNSAAHSATTHRSGLHRNSDEQKVEDNNNFTTGAESSMVRSVTEIALGSFAPDKSLPLIVALASVEDDDSYFVSTQIIVHRILIRNMHISEAVRAGPRTEGVRGGAAARPGERVDAAVGGRGGGGARAGWADLLWAVQRAVRPEPHHRRRPACARAAGAARQGDPRGQSWH